MCEVCASMDFVIEEEEEEEEEELGRWMLLEEVTADGMRKERI